MAVRREESLTSLNPAIREFLDGLAEMIADLILEDEGREGSDIESAPTGQQGAETC